MSAGNDFWARRGHAMEDAFFRDIDAKLLEKLKEEAQSEVGREELIRKTGMMDGKLIEELVNQGVTAEGLIALRVMPLVLVAWADREVTDAERKTVLEEAHKMGIVEGEIPHLFLEQWLRVRPAADLGDAWKRYTLDLLDRMKAEERAAYISELKREMTAVANASGGILGIGKISHAESRLMEMLLEALE